MITSALDVIRRVETLGGRLVLEGDELKLRAAEPLPSDLVASVTEQRAAIMVALGAPLNIVISDALAELRPYLPPALRRLPDERLLTLVNWAIIAAFDSAIRRVSR